MQKKNPSLSLHLRFLRSPRKRVSSQSSLERRIRRILVLRLILRSHRKRFRSRNRPLNKGYLTLKIRIFKIIMKIMTIIRQRATSMKMMEAIRTSMEATIPKVMLITMMDTMKIVVSRTLLMLKTIVPSMLMNSKIPT